MFGYRPESINRDIFFQEVNQTLDKAINKYENILFIGDLNIDLNIPNHDKKHLLEDMCDTFDLTNMVKEKTCFMSAVGSSIDLILTNKPKSFYKTIAIETGLSDHHKMVVTFLRNHISLKLKPKNIEYRNTKNMNWEQFKIDIANIHFDEITRFSNSYTGFTTLFKSIVDRHAPIKKKTIRGNNKPFMNIELTKAIKNKSRIRNKYNKWKSRENYIEFQQIKKKCKYLTFKAEKEHFEKILSKGIITNKEFWGKVAPALSGKNPKHLSDIILKESDDKLITDDFEISEILNKNYINIVENTTGNPPLNLGDFDLSSKESINQYIDKIILHYKEHPSIIKINETFDKTDKPPFNIPLPDIKDIEQILKNINVKKVAGPDLILPALVKYVSELIKEPLKDIIEEMIKTHYFPNDGKTAHVTPGLKPDKDRKDKSSYRPISLIGIFGKILERYIQNKISDYIDSLLSDIISAYRKKYSTNNVLMRLIENWKNNLDKKKHVGAVLMDLSKAFDCVPHDLLIAKMHAYNFDKETLTLFFTYLKNRQQGVKVNNCIHSYLMIISGVPQGTILGPILFNLFINDMALFLKNSSLSNYSDDNTISAFANTLKDLINTLEKESNIAIEWLEINNMIVNTDKFQAIIINRNPNQNPTNEHIIKLNEHTITSQNCVTQLGMEIDDQLTFTKHIKTKMRKAAGQLNYLNTKEKFLNPEAKKVLIESFIMSNFNYCPLVWMFCNSNLKRIQENIQKRALRFLLNDYESNYDQLLEKSNKSTIEIRKLRILALEIFKTINNLNPPYMKEIFELNTSRNPERKMLMVKVIASKKYGTDSLRHMGPKIWNHLSLELKNSESLTIFKGLIKSWSGPSCHCHACN